MHNTALAEWTLARFTGKPQAATIIGDLEEASARKGSSWFWRTYLKILLACAWRPTVAYAIILLISDWETRITWKFTQYSVKAHGAAPLYSGWFGLFLTFLVPALMTITVFTLVRFGLRDIVTRLAAAYLLLGFSGVYLWWVPALRIAALAVAVALMLFSLFSPAGRRGMASLALMTAAPPILFLAFFGAVLLAHFCGVTIPERGVPLAGPSLVLVACIIFGRVHRSLDERRQVVNN